MAVELYAGTLSDFNDSMAKEIEDALDVLLGPLPLAPDKLVNDRRALFIAIATGVINHLRTKQAALDINIGPVTTDFRININVRS